MATVVIYRRLDNGWSVAGEPENTRKTLALAGLAVRSVSPKAGGNQRFPIDFARLWQF